MKPISCNQRNGGHRKDFVPRSPTESCLISAGGQGDQDGNRELQCWVCPRSCHGRNTLLRCNLQTEHLV